jgi:hypothetical protein
MSAAFIAANKSVLDPTGKGTVDVSGGFHDAGDHVKFGLPQGYAISTLGWGFYEFNQAFVELGQDGHMLDILRWGCDYLIRSTFLNSSGEVIAFCYQVGEGAVDHPLWAPPEVENLDRPAYFATSETPASDVTAEAAAALAIMYLNTQSSDPTYAAQCLTYAKALYAFAVANPGFGYSGGFYNSSSYYDDLSWAAVWLYIATGQQSYINDITATDSSGNYTGYLKAIIGNATDSWQNIWVHSWDSVWGGMFIKLAPIINTPTYWYYARWNLEYWSHVPHQDSTDTTFLAWTPGGFAVIASWGSCRYNTAAQLCALVYGKDTGDMRFAAWAQSQMGYIFGNNPLNNCYMIGYAANSVVHPSHRAAHGSFDDSMFDPINPRHTLWGALVGGPDSSDNYIDETSQYVYSEVAVDYSAAFVGALAGHYLAYGAGQTINSSFTTAETPVNPYFIQVALNQNSSQGTQITMTLNADTSQPPQFVTGLTARYFFSISELLAVGQTANDVTVAVYYDQNAENPGGGPTAVSGPFAWNGSTTIYYFEFDWSAYSLWYQNVLEIGINVAIASDYLFHWDATNDWSYQGILAASQLTPTPTPTPIADVAPTPVPYPYIPVYLNGTLVYGLEPSGSTTGTPTPTSSPTPTPTPKPTATSSPTPKPTATSSPTPTPRPTATSTPTPKPTATSTPTPKPTATSTPTPRPTATSTPTPKPTATSTPTPTPTATSGVSASVHYAVVSQWSGGFEANITITNTGTTTINGWTLVFSFPGTQQVTQGWSGSFAQSGSQVTVTNLSYNGSIAPGTSVTPGFNASWSGSNPNPTAFTLNGKAATVV